MKSIHKLREVRKAKGLTQEEVSEFLNMSQANYSDIENGKVVPSLTYIMKLCKLYKVSPNDLLGWDEE